MTPEEWKLALQAGGTVISMIALICTALGLWRTAANIQTATYTELDKAYSRILELALDNPFLRDPGRTSHYPAGFSNAQKPVYDSYAFIVWNYVESITDRCAGDAVLKETWDPVVRVECELHRRWLEDANNQKGFKRRFLQAMGISLHPEALPSMG